MSYKIANELVGKGFFGAITQIETYTNRNSDHGAWIRPIDERGNPENINWKEFIGDAPWEEFNPDRYFNWQRFDKFGTSVTGNQFTHAYDCVNQIVGIGIPASAMALGGTYHYKDDRDMPDVLNAIFNYPNHGLTLSYASTLKNSRYRETLIMGSDASLLVDINLLVFKDSRSGKFEEITIDPSDPIYMYIPTENIDAISSATTLPYVRGGYGPTLIDGKRQDTTYLHLKEWIDAIRSNGKPSCDIDQGVEETVTFNMANISYRSNKHVRWDHENKHVELV
jgi:predicted dehydrogenase